MQARHPPGEAQPAMSKRGEARISHRAGPARATSGRAAAFAARRDRRAAQAIEGRGGGSALGLRRLAIEQDVLAVRPRAGNRTAPCPAGSGGRPIAAHGGHVTCPAVTSPWRKPRTSSPDKRIKGAI